MSTWVGNPPAKCDICSRPITTLFVDGRTQSGPWANMCFSCHRSHGCGIGQGKGQKYRLTDGKWLKVGG